MARVYNFSAGPAVLPIEVLKEAQEEMLDYRGCGMSVMEMSHRGKVFDGIIKEAEKDLREIMNIPDNYKVLFLQGGAHQQFSAVPMNMTRNGKAATVVEESVPGSRQVYGSSGCRFFRGQDFQLHSRLFRSSHPRGCGLRIHLREQHDLRNQVLGAPQHQGT